MADPDELVFQPTFEQPKGGGTRTPEQRDDAAAVKTYRYLRLGMVVIVVGIVASILIERSDAGCWQSSMSAYYYTPVRAVFVSGLVAIGAALVIIKGSTAVEDGLLNVAGALTPVVAFVPTSFDAGCDAAGGARTGPGGLPAAIVDDVRNNIGAVLVAGAVAMGVAIVVFVVEQVRGGDLATRHGLWHAILLGLTVLMLGFGWWALASDRILGWHGEAAVAMFGVLAAGSIFNGVWLWRMNRGSGPTTSPRWRAFAVLYVAVGVAMVVGGVVLQFLWPDPWEHRTLVVELVEIALFGAMWVVQSVERWGKILQPPA